MRLPKWYWFALLVSFAVAGCGGGDADDSLETKRSIQASAVSMSRAANELPAERMALASATATNAVANPTFESGASGWTISQDVLTLDASAAHGGSYYAWLGGYNGANDYLYQNVTIPSGATQAYLQFWYRISTGESGTTAYDYMRVRVKNASTDQTLATLKSYSNLNTTAGWVQSAQFDLSAYKGQTIKLHFEATTDSTNSTSFRIDDVSVTVDTGGTTTNPDASSYTTAVQQLYIAYFGRPADPSGLTNFAAALAAANAPTTIQGLVAAYGTNSTIKALVDAFGTSAESNTLYSGNTESFVNAIYQNVLNRAADSGGLDFWRRAIDSGNLTKGNAALSIMSGALSNTTAQGQIDALVVNNKVAVGTSFTTSLATDLQKAAYSGDTAAATVRAMLANVTHTTSLSEFQVTITNTVTVLVSSSGATTNPKLTTSTSGSGQGSVTPASGTYTRGQIVTVTPQAHFSSEFTGWTSNSTGCVGSISSCRLTMDKDYHMQAQFEPAVFRASFDGTYRTELAGTCVWNVTWTNSRVELKFVLSNGSYVGKLRITGRRESSVVSGSTCNPTIITVDRTIDVGYTTSGFAAKASSFSGSGTEYLTIATFGDLPGPTVGNVAGFVPVQISLEYTGTNRSGSTSMMGTMTRGL